MEKLYKILKCESMSIVPADLAPEVSFVIFIYIDV